jgi:hypothetical protein
MLRAVKPSEFEQAVLELAMTTRVPLTRANILFYSGVSAKQAEKWLDEMLGNGLLEFDSDDSGEILYNVCGAKRPPSGATQLTRCSACRRATGAGARCTRCGQLLDPQLRALRSDIERAGSAIDLVRRGGSGLLPPTREGDKNILVAGALGLLGPMGWFYAAPLAEAGLATGAFLMLYWLLPHLTIILMSLLLPVSAFVGAAYAWKHNRAGHRSSLFTERDESP